EILHSFKVHVAEKASAPPAVPVPPGPPAKEAPPEKTAKEPAPQPAPAPQTGIRPAPLQEDRETRPLPGIVSAVCVGGSGRLLILQIPKQRQVAISDANQAKIVKYLPLPEDDAKVAAGADKLLVYAPGANAFQRYSLATFQREVTAASPRPGPIAKILMGSAS